MPKPELEFFKVDSIEPVVKPSGTEQILSHDPDTGDTTMILFYPPGMKQGSQPCIHDYWEEVLILSGAIYDRSLDRWIRAGEYACRPPGMIHGPYDADLVEGVKQFIWVRYESKK